MDINEYILQRVDFQINWYNVKSIYNHKMFNLLQGSIVAGAIITPIVSGFIACEYKWVTTVLGGILAVAIGILNLLKYQEKWLRQRAACEMLKREKYLYQNGASSYTNLAQIEKEQKFVERIESLIELEQDRWIQEHGYKIDGFQIGVK